MSHSPTKAVSSDEAVNYTSSLGELVRLVESGMSHSGHERNCCFLNTGGGRFANVSTTSGFDLPDDTRAIVPVDWDSDGDLDLWIANRTAPQLRLFRNRAGNGREYVSLRLVGKTVNRDGIGARVSIEFESSDRRDDGPPLVQTLRAGDGFLSQGSKWLHFGVHGAPEIKHVVVHWPGAEKETFSGVKSNDRFHLVQGTGKAKRLDIKPRETKLTPARLDPPAATAQARIWLSSRPPMPQITCDDLSGRKRTITPREAAPLLVNLWATWCAPCGKELKEMAQRSQEFEKRGVDVLALSVDALGENGGDRQAVRSFTSKMGFPFEVGLAHAEFVDKLEIVYRNILARHVDLPVPTSVLIDKKGQLAAIYLGAVEMDTLIDDLAHLDDEPEQRRAHGDPIAGRWYTKPQELALDEFAKAYLRSGYPREALTILKQVHPRTEKDVVTHNQMGAALLDLDEASKAEVHFRKALAGNPGHIRARFNLGLSLVQQRRVDEAIGQFRQVVKIDPDWADAHVNLARALESKEQWFPAEASYREALRIDPKLVPARNDLAVVLARRGQTSQAAAELQRVLGGDPDNAAAHHNLGLVMMQLQRTRDAVTHLKKAVATDQGDPDYRNSLGVALAAVGKAEEALPHYREALKVKPRDANIHYNLAAAYQQQGQATQALAHYRQAQQLAPQRPLMANALARMMATAANEKLRQGPEAVRLAEQACQATRNTVPELLDTLAAAYASVGDFKKAAATATKAATLARSRGNQQLSQEIQQRLRLYQDGKPYFE